MFITIVGYKIVHRRSNECTEKLKDEIMIQGEKLIF